MSGRRRPPALPPVRGNTVPEVDRLRLRHLVALALALLGLVAALLTGLWGLGADRGADATSSSEGWIEITDGWVHLDDVVDRSVVHSGMPNMQTMPDADPVPDGHARYLVQLSVAADERGLTWDVGDLHVSGAGMSTARPHAVELGDGRVPPGSTVSGTVTIDVPEEARDLVLTFGRARLPLDQKSSGTEAGHGHDETHVHDDSHPHATDADVPRGPGALGGGDR